MAKIERVDRGLYRVENKDGTISWQIDYLNPDKKRIRKTFSTKKQAVDERATRISLIGKGEYSEFVKKKKNYTATFLDLVELYVGKKQGEPHFDRTEKSFIPKFREYFKDERLLADIGHVHLEDYRDNLKKSLNQHGRLMSKSSINSEISCLSKMFKMAKKHKMIGKNPFEGEETLRFKKLNNARKRFLTTDEAKKLFDASPIHLQHIIECALYTGLRKENILSLKWHQIRNGWIYVKTKTGDKEVPVSDEMQNLLDRIKASQAEPKQKNVVDMKGKPVERTGTKSEYVFLYKGKPIEDCKIALQGACKRAGIPYGRYVTNGITFHDLRHSFGSLLAEKNVHPAVMQELLTHEDPIMTKRYTHMGDDAKKRAVNSLDWNLHEKSSMPPDAT